MEPEPPDRRVQRTRQLLRTALMDLILEKGYDAVTIQDITKRANLGRTTFYLHYQSKDDLFLEHHEGFATGFYLGAYARDELLGDHPSAMFVRFLDELQNNRDLYFKIASARDFTQITERIRQQIARNLEASLRAAFDETGSAIPFLFLAQYIAGAQISFVTWWLETRNDYTAQDVGARLHRLQRAAIQDALGNNLR